jgi:hypothetical protein
MAMPSVDLDELLHIHVRYELDMLFATFELLRLPASNVVVGNALIESFCMHARALIDFFDNTQGLEAREFTDAAYRPLPKDQLGISDTLINKLNTQIAHLTKKRVDAPSLKIGVTDRQNLRDGLLRALRHFEQHLLPSHRGQWQTYSLSVIEDVATQRSGANVFQAATGTTTVTMVNSIAVANGIPSAPRTNDADPDL